MSDSSGWRPLQRRGSVGSFDLAGFLATPFGKLARTHAVSAFGDAMIAVALAGSIFFSVAPDAARWRVAAYLLLTIAPFAIVTPLIGPAIDRAKGGRRLMVMGAASVKLVLALLMVSHIDTFLLFPEAFLMLVMQKSYSVAKSAIVPQTLDGTTSLIDANSTLALISAVASVAGAAVGGVFLLGGPELVSGVAVFVFALVVVAARALPRGVVAAEPIGDDERAELSSSGIILAGSAMALMRGIVGFLTFLLAFDLRRGGDGVPFHEEGSAVGVATAAARDIDVMGEPGAPAWHFGVVVVLAGLGAFLGARTAPLLRPRMQEETILSVVTAATAVAAVMALWSGGLLGAAGMALCVGVTASIGKLAFDSLVQRDAPDANYGRSFARFEARFQMTWVVGAFIAVGSPIRNARFGYLVIAAVATFAAVSYYLGRKALLDRGSRVEAGTDVDDTEGEPDRDTDLPGAPTDGAGRTEGGETAVAPDPSLGASPPLESDPDGAVRWSQPEIFDTDPGGDATVEEVAGREDDLAGGQPDGSEPVGGDAEPRWGAPVDPQVSSVDGVEVDADPGVRDRREGR